MKQIKHLSVVLLVLCLCVGLMSVTASAAGGSFADGLTWTYADGTITISGNGPMEDYTYKSDAPWYDYHEEVTTVIIESGITHVGEDAFHDYDALSRIELPDTLKSIGKFAFSAGEALTSVTIPEGVEEIGMYAFYQNYDLAEVSLPDSLMEVGINAFAHTDYIYNNIDANGCVIGGSTLLYCNSAGGAVTVPNGVKCIAKGAFENSHLITSLTLPEGLLSISGGAFEGWEKLTEVSMPDSVVRIGYGAFNMCTALTRVHIPESLKELGGSAFNGCAALEMDIMIPEGVERIEGYTFSGSGITSVILPNSVTSVDWYAFSECPNLTRVEFGEGLTTIGECVFWHCPKLENLFFPASVTTICESAFEGCTSLTGIVFAEGEEDLTIEDDAFAYCDLREVHLPQQLLTIESDAFYANMNLTGVWFDGDSRFYSDDRGCLYKSDWSDLELVIVPQKLSGTYTVPKEVTKISAIFHFCSDLEVLYLGDGGIRNFRLDNFFGCTSLKAVHAGEHDENDNGYFYNDEQGALYYRSYGSSNLYFVPNNLTSFTIPADVSSVGGGVFNNGVVENIYVAEGNERFTSVNGVLYNSDGTRLLNYPAGKKNASFTVPAKVENVDAYAFAFCDSLKTVTFKGDNPDLYDDFIFYGVTATCYYPAGNETWEGVAEAQEGYGGKLTWKPTAPTKITKQPTTQKVKNGTKATFTIKATGNGLKYQWQYKASAKAAWKNCTAVGNKTATMKVPATNAKSGYRYRCVITDSAGNKVTSKTVYLYVLGVRTQPVSKDVKAGTAVKFTVNAAGHGKTYQWQFRTSSKVKWVNTTATGAKTATLKLNATVARNGYQYRCVIKDSAGNTIYTKPVTLNVFGIKYQPDSTTAIRGTNAKFYVTAVGTDLKYQWQYKGADGKWYNATATGAKTRVLTVKARGALDGRQYRCRITDGKNRVIFTNVVKLTVK